MCAWVAGWPLPLALPSASGVGGSRPRVRWRMVGTVVRLLVVRRGRRVPAARRCGTDARRWVDGWNGPRALLAVVGRARPGSGWFGAVGGLAGFREYVSPWRRGDQAGSARRLRRR